MSNKKGMALYIYKILLELVVVILIIATILGIINTCSSNTEESAKDNFELLAGVMDSFVKSDKEFVSVQIFVPDDHYLVAFDNPTAGSIVKPSSCYDSLGETACLCLYNADPFQNIDAAKRDNGLVEECKKIGSHTDNFLFSRVYYGDKTDLHYKLGKPRGQSANALWFVYHQISGKPIQQIVLVKGERSGRMVVTAYEDIVHSKPVVLCEKSTEVCGATDVFSKTPNDDRAELEGCFGYICEQPDEYCRWLRTADTVNALCIRQLNMYSDPDLISKDVQIDNTIQCGTYQAYYNQRTPNDPDDFVIAYGAQCPVDQTCVFSRLLPQGPILPSGLPQSTDNYPIEESSKGDYLNYVGVWEGECKPTS